ncbi:hypothetical protein CRUP_013075 [Coryphaenoides rupestris]|nr:hypothetical protein CRUP_013075 [Coryphaenoides rupestris]
MVSLAPDREMEPEPPTEEPKQSPVLPEDPDELEAFSGPVDTDAPAEAEGVDELGPGPGEEPRSEEEVEMVSQREDGEDDCRLRKKILKPGPPEAPRPNWGQEVTVKLQGVLEDRSVVEKDRKLVFVVGEADVIQKVLEYIVELDEDDERYLRYFLWRRHYKAESPLLSVYNTFTKPTCYACDYVSKHKGYRAVHHLYHWHFSSCLPAFYSFAFVFSFERVI